MTPETITIVGVGVTLLVAVAATYFSLRRNSNDRFSTLEEKVDALAKDFYLTSRERISPEQAASWLIACGYDIPPDLAPHAAAKEI